MKAIIHTYNAIELIWGRVLFTEASMKDILDTLKKSNFVEIDGCITAVNQVTLVRQANGKEYFQKFILHTLHVSILWKMKSWVAQMDDPSIDGIFSQISIFEEEEKKYASALRSMTPEELENRRKAVAEMKNKFKPFSVVIDTREISPDRAWTYSTEIEP